MALHYSKPPCSPYKMTGEGVEYKESKEAPRLYLDARGADLSGYILVINGVEYVRREDVATKEKP